jgi:branched-chain amino acid transport system permease protein
VFPYIVLGLFGGSIYALASLGIVLTYKTSGIFNFAYGGVAMFCSYVFWQMRDQWHLSQWLVIPLLLLVVAPVLGLILEAVFRPLATASAEVQIVVALGMLSLFVTIVPIIFGGSDHQLPSIFPQGHFRWGRHLFVTWNEAGTFILAFVLAGALYLLLRRTRLGTATRAVVDNRDLAGLNGVNAGTVGRMAWITSTVFAAIAGVLLSTQEGLVTFVLPALVIYAFAPAVLGRLTSLPLAFAGALALGLLQNILARYGSSGFVAKLEASIPYLALFVLLVAYGRRLKEVRSSLRPLTGTGPAGSGGPRAAHLAGHHGSLFPLAVVVGMAIAIPLGLIVGLPSLRLSGLFLALATMAFALLMDNLVFSNTLISGGLTGLNLTAARLGPLSLRSYTSQYYLCLTALAVAAFGVYWLRQGPVGRRLQMVRDAPNAAATLGANLTVTKLAVFGAGAALAALGGSLLAMTQQTVDPNNFSFNQSLALLLVVVLGGRALVSGALIAGGLQLVQLLPLPAAVDRYLPLGVALGVINIAKVPDGTLRVAAQHARYCLGVLYRRPRPEWLVRGEVSPALRMIGATQVARKHG